MHDSRRVSACLSEALQRGLTTYDDLVSAHVHGSPRNSRLARDALEALGAGARSAPEADFRRLVMTSPMLPGVEFNAWLRLPSGRVVCVDALIPSSAVVHETNGRQAHAREDLFEDMQERHDALTASGFTVVHNSSRRIRSHGREVLAQVERCHELYDGRGMPPGVYRLASAA
jgi:very-short-patch-repair endonuclease